MSKMTEGKKRFVKRALREGRPTIWIGKSGASEEICKEIDRQLKKNQMVKVRILQSGLAGCEAKQLATEIASKTDASLVEVRGHTFMLYRRRTK